MSPPQTTVVTVVIKVAENGAHGHKRDPGLDETPRQERLFPKAIAAVGIPDTIRLLIQTERPLRLAGQDHGQGQTSSRVSIAIPSQCRLVSDG